MAFVQWNERTWVTPARAIPGAAAVGTQDPSGRAHAAALRRAQRAAQGAGRALVHPLVGEPALGARPQARPRQEQAPAGARDALGLARPRASVAARMTFFTSETQD